MEHSKGSAIKWEEMTTLGGDVVQDRMLLHKASYRPIKSKCGGIGEILKKCHEVTYF